MSRKDRIFTDKAGPILEKIDQGLALPKCRACGCLHQALAAFEKALAGTSGGEARELREKVHTERVRLEAESYDCLGCDSCWGAEAIVLCAEFFGEGDFEPSGVFCPTSPTPKAAPECGQLSSSWPPVPGDYLVGNRQGAVAICTLSSHDLPAQIMALGEPALALVGKCFTENIGIEKLLRNIIATPSIRWLILCGEEASGHRPGEALLQLKEQGVDAAMRIQGANSWRPVLNNLSLKDVARFRRQVAILDLIGNSNPAAIRKELQTCLAGPTEPLEEYHGDSPLLEVPRVMARKPAGAQLDPAGFFIVLLDRMKKILICEHYANDGTLSHIIEGRKGALIAATVIEKGIVSRLDHAAYLGRELAKAEFALRSGTTYLQDAALGALDREGAGSPSDCDKP